MTELEKSNFASWYPVEHFSRRLTENTSLKLSSKMPNDKIKAETERLPCSRYPFCYTHLTMCSKKSDNRFSASRNLVMRLGLLWTMTSSLSPRISTGTW